MLGITTINAYALCYYALLSIFHTECQVYYAECGYAECHYAECDYAECRGTL
jgi:hypothetical protein